MAAILSRLAGLALIILGMAFFPFALMGFLYTLGGRAPLGVGLTMVAVDALLLLAGATGVVGLWRRPKPDGADQ
ncbi:MAG TPA: hypothetical protein VFI28_00150 [Candidatus Limnocylindrales bacterium]|nr:hypothetical protein [Candidatus Limnocylindrales bacterium]